jgi:hypothetical protein
MVVAGSYRRATTGTFSHLYRHMHAHRAAFDSSSSSIWSTATCQRRRLVDKDILLAVQGDHYQACLRSGNCRRHGQFGEGDENFDAKLLIPTYKSSRHWHTSVHTLERKSVILALVG